MIDRWYGVLLIVTSLVVLLAYFSRPEPVLQGTSEDGVCSLPAGWGCVDGKPYPVMRKHP